MLRQNDRYLPIQIGRNAVFIVEPVYIIFSVCFKYSCESPTGAPRRLRFRLWCALASTTTLKRFYQLHDSSCKVLRADVFTFHNILLRYSGVSWQSSCRKAFARERWCKPYFKNGIKEHVRPNCLETLYEQSSKNKFLFVVACCVGNTEIWCSCAETPQLSYRKGNFILKFLDCCHNFSTYSFNIL